MNRSRNTDQDPHRYDDMLDLPHQRSATRPHMKRIDRAAQFSPFAALTGYDDEIRETARLTDQKIELDENSKELLDKKLRYITDHLPERPVVSFIYFVPDAWKDGGSYVAASGTVKKVDMSERKVVLYAENGISNGAVINMDDIAAVTGDLFGEMEGLIPG